jgi:hypothetical protein
MWIGRWNIEHYPTRPKYGIFYSDQQVCISEVEDENGQKLLEIYREDVGSTSWARMSHKQAGRNPRGRLYYTNAKTLSRRIKEKVRLCYRYCEQVWQAQALEQARAQAPVYEPMIAPMDGSLDE